MSLKLYYDLMSQPSRALYIFLKAAQVPYTDCALRLAKGQHLTPEFETVNPFKKVPAIEHGQFKLSESVAIFRYACREFPVAEHWYPKASQARAKVDEYLEWQHLNVRLGGAMYFMTKILNPMMTGKPVNEKSLKNYEAKLEEALDHLENIFLKEHKFIAGDEISFADISCACELEQPRSVGFDIYKNNQRPRLAAWMKRVREKLQPLYDEAHTYIFKFGKSQSNL